MQLVIYCPEVVVEQYVGDGVPQRHPTAGEEWYEIETGNDEPSRIDADIASPVELDEARTFRPCEPHSNTTEEKENIYSHVAASAEAKGKRVVPLSTDMEQQNNYHGKTHKLATIPTQVSPMQS